jgi:Flp pilus assembly protein TadD
MESKREEEMFFKLHATLADLLRSNSLWTEAQIQYDKVISYQKKQKKEDWKIYYKRGIAFERQGSEYWNFAEQDLIYALSLNPEQPEVLNYLGYSWIEMNKNIEEAGKMLQKAVDQRPDSGYIIDSLGWAYFKLGRYNEALTQLELAAELNPNDPVINDHLGDVYWMVNKHLQARFQWEKALLFDPQEYLIPILEHKLLFGLDS